MPETGRPRPTHGAPERVASPALGAAGRSRDLLFGWAAVVPLGLLVVIAVLGVAGPGPVRTLSVYWSAILLSFLGGVRRGLTFSEARGGRRGEIATMILLFVVALAILILTSPLLGALSLTGVGVLDAAAARRAETPGYFRWFRPVQMGLCAAAMVAIDLATRSR